MKVLGISEGFHDAAICILNDTKMHHPVRDTVE